MPHRRSFKSARARERVLRTYEHRLARWPGPPRELDLVSPFGRTHVVISGPERGLPVLLLHGGMANAAMWQPFIEQFGPGARLFALDAPWAPGKGEFSGRWPEGPHRWLASVLDVLELERAALVGFSAGASLAMHALPGLGRRASRFVAISAGPDPARVPGRVVAWSVLAAAFGSRRAHDRLMATLAPSGRVDEETRSYFAELARSCLPPKGLPRDEPFAPPSKVETPSLFVLGEREPFLSLEAARARVEEHFRDARVEIIEGAGHLCFAEYPERVFGEVARFLAG